MTERDDNWRQQQEQEEAQWIEEHKGWYACVYCGEVYAEQPVIGCCKENHFEIIGE